LPYFGLGQMYVHREELDNAIICFEKVLKLHPSNYDTLKVLGSLYAHSEPIEQKEKLERRQKAKELLKKVVEMCADDVEALIELAQLTESSDPQVHLIQFLFFFHSLSIDHIASLDAYTKAADFLQNTLQVDVPPEITNNIGSLAFSMGQYQRAKESFEKASQKISDDISAGHNELSGLQTTVTYNLARCLEMLCLFDDAERLYKSILHEKPSYIDCYMRLGCLARDKGQIYESSVWFKVYLGFIV
uniref:RNA polymerase-associated protein CTR9 homolog (inferred by orthology to a human protein) n=1 Tax=Anisakis simplex TaxID=6269 RepID=A0A0M3KHN1_ANISI